MGFQDLSEFFTPGLTLPIRGKEYHIPEAPAADGLRLMQLVAANGLDGNTETREALKLLGATWVVEDEELPVFDPETGLQAIDDDGNSVTRTVAMGRWAGGLYDEMSADGLSMDEIIHAGITALVKTAQGLAEAEKFWNERGIAAKAVASGNPVPPSMGANRAQKRAAAKAPTKKTAAKKATRKSSSRASTAASTTRGRARTAKTTPAAPTTTR
jgi:hypothetical protein